MEKISVIVPVYNVEEYLAECVESILNQTYSNIEIILVDDCSSDRSGQICDQYAKMDNRIKVLLFIKILITQLSRHKSPNNA